MNATDLRIGNYHFYRIVDDLDERKEYDEICQIDYGDLRILTEFKDSPEYKPIPLTKEWLLKFGFVKEERYYARGVHQRLFSGLMNLKFDRLLQMWVFSVGRYSDITRIEYVHQLQNLYFALTGEELTINDTKNEMR